MSNRILNQTTNSINHNINRHIGQKVAQFTLKVAIAAIATLPITALGVSSARANHEDSFGAIARSSSTEGKGYAWNYATRTAASNRARRECESVSGNGDCEVLLWFKNACGSIAESTDGAAGTGWGTSTALAQSAAMDSCAGVSSYRACSITRTFCTPQ